MPARPDSIDPVVAIVDTTTAPWGSLGLAVSSAGVAGLELSGSVDRLVAGVARRLGGPVRRLDSSAPGDWLEIMDSARQQLAAYFEGSQRAFDLAADLGGVSEWDRMVLDGARRLGYGQTASYGILARMIGRPGAARAVGGALGRNPIPILIPCHRIVAADGTLGGYGGAWEGERERLLEVKRTLLRIEGAEPAGHENALAR